MLNYVLYAVLAVNVVTWAAFAIDKWKARRQARRIPEKWLIGLSWATGFVGGWIAMGQFRHKTIKKSFRIRMYLVSIFNLAWVLVWLWWRGDLA